MASTRRSVLVRACAVAAVLAVSACSSDGGDPRPGGGAPPAGRAGAPGTRTPGGGADAWASPGTSAPPSTRPAPGNPGAPGGPGGAPGGPGGAPGGPGGAPGGPVVSRGERLIKSDSFTVASDVELTSHRSDTGGSWSGADSGLLRVVGARGAVVNPTGGRRVALAAEPVATQFQVAEVTGRTGTGEFGAVVGFSGGHDGGTGYLLRVDAAGVVTLAALANGAVTTLHSFDVGAWNPDADRTLRLVYEPSGNGYATLVAYLDGTLVATGDGPGRMYAYRSARLGRAGAPGIYLRDGAAAVTATRLYTTDGLSGGYYTWPNVTLPYRVRMDANMAAGGSASMNVRVATGVTVGGRGDSMKVDLSAKTPGVEGYGGTGMGQPPEWRLINGRTRQLSVRWQQYLGPTLHVIRNFKQQIVVGDVSRRRGAVLVSGDRIGVGIPAAVDWSPQVVAGRWQEFEAFYDYAGERATLRRHDNGAGVVSSYALTGFGGNAIVYPEGIGWYWDDAHFGPTDADTYAAMREVYFSRTAQGPSD